MGNTEFKHILVSPKTHKKLANLGKKHESFDKIIAELIELRNMNTANRDKHSKTNTISQISPKDCRPREESMIPSTKNYLSDKGVASYG